MWRLKRSQKSLKGFFDKLEAIGFLPMASMFY